MYSTESAGMTRQYDIKRQEAGRQSVEDLLQGVGAKNTDCETSEVVLLWSFAAADRW